jgi:hypothetical protein
MRGFVGKIVKTNFIAHKNVWLGWEGRRVTTSESTRQLILEMTSDHQTVDHTNKIMGNNHDSILVRFRTGCNTGRHKLRWHNFSQKNHTTTSLVRSSNIRVHTWNTTHDGCGRSGNSNVCPICVTPCDPRTFCFNSLPSSSLNDGTWSFLRTPLLSWHRPPRTCNTGTGHFFFLTGVHCFSLFFLSVSLSLSLSLYTQFGFFWV